MNSEKRPRVKKNFERGNERKKVSFSPRVATFARNEIQKMFKGYSLYSRAFQLLEYHWQEGKFDKQTCSEPPTLPTSLWMRQPQCSRVTRFECCGWKDWGCLSHKVKRVGGLLLVWYQIYPTAFDTLVTRMVEVVKKKFANNVPHKVLLVTSKKGSLRY